MVYPRYLPSICYKFRHTYFFSKIDADDLYLQCVFTGVVVGGLTYNSKMDWQIVLSLAKPMVELARKLYDQYDSAEFYNLLIIAGLTAIGVVISLLPTPLNEMDYFVVDAFMGYTGMKLMSVALVW